ncbi:hypothetical protein RB200_28830 [Streptomyces sp. PmtG]
MPSYRCFPSAKKEGSWLLGTHPPTEGSLDRETWIRLTGILAQYSPAGPDTRCLAYYNPLLLGAVDFDDLHVRAGQLADAETLYDDSDAGFSPSNLWADDRSWVLCTDYDLWATKVAGPPALIDALKPTVAATASSADVQSTRTLDMRHLRDVHGTRRTVG